MSVWISYSGSLLCTIQFFLNKWEVPWLSQQICLTFCDLEHSTGADITVFPFCFPYDMCLSFLRVIFLYTWKKTPFSHYEVSLISQWWQVKESSCTAPKTQPRAVEAPGHRNHRSKWWLWESTEGKESNHLGGRIFHFSGYISVEQRKGIRLETVEIIMGSWKL